MNQPSAFIGSSTEGLEFARAIRSLLVQDTEVTLWNEGFFTVGSTFIESLVNSLPRFDFAVLVLTPDDLVHSRNDEHLGPRDNVIFELGLFMGRLGRSRTFIVHQSGSGLKIPTDLSGVTTAQYYWPRDDNNYESAVGAACDSIRRAIRDLGFSEEKASKRIQEVAKEQQRQKQEIDALSFLVSHFIPLYEIQHMEKLANGEPFPFSMHEGFERELRHLSELHFITKNYDFKITEMPEKDDLRRFFTLTDHGRMYLQLRQEAQTKSKDFLE